MGNWEICCTSVWKSCNLASKTFMCTEIWLNVISRPLRLILSAFRCLVMPAKNSQIHQPYSIGQFVCLLFISGQKLSSFPSERKELLQCGSPTSPSHNIYIYTQPGHRMGTATLVVVQGFRENLINCLYHQFHT